MAPGRAGAFAGGAGLVWRRQKLLWWIFAVNFALAFIAIHGVVPRVGAVMDHSMAAQRLVNGFDVGALLELSVQPGISPWTYRHPIWRTAWYFLCSCCLSPAVCWKFTGATCG